MLYQWKLEWVILKMNNNIRNISFEKTNFSHLNLKNDKDVKVAIWRGLSVFIFKRKNEK